MALLKLLLCTAITFVHSPSADSTYASLDFFPSFSFFYPFIQNFFNRIAQHPKTSIWILTIYPERPHFAISFFHCKPFTNRKRNDKQIPMLFTKLFDLLQVSYYFHQSGSFLSLRDQSLVHTDDSQDLCHYQHKKISTTD